jgi:hypothetical protein
LNSLPETLDETYDRILMNIHVEHRDRAFKVLQWLAFSARPVTLAEVTGVLAVNYDHGIPRYDRDLHLFDPFVILRICSSLVTISNWGDSDLGEDWGWDENWYQDAALPGNVGQSNQHEYESSHHNPN